jgi:hypothetical protein
LETKNVGNNTTTIYMKEINILIGIYLVRLKMAGIVFMANPNKETGHLPTSKDRALTPL